MPKYSVSKRKLRVKNKTYKYGGMVSRFLGKKIKNTNKPPSIKIEKIEDDFHKEISKMNKQNKEEEEELERLKKELITANKDIVEHKKEEEWYKNDGSMDTYEMELDDFTENKEDLEIEVKIQEYRLELITKLNEERKVKYENKIRK